MYSFVKTTMALVNSMIGCSILIFPILFVENGLLVSIGVMILAAISAAYSNLISLRHMTSQQNDFQDTICRHNKTTESFPWFVLFVFLSCQLCLYSYFNLIIKNWTGLFYRSLWIHDYIPVLALISLVVFILGIKKIHMGVTLMAIGIISVVITLLFISWMFYSRPQPQIKQFPLVKGDSLTDLLTLAIAAVSLQNVFVEILREHPAKQDRTKIICIAYGIGIVVYLYVGIVGGYGVLERTPVYQNAKTIMQYFYADKWQPFVLEIIYLIHFYSVWPEWASLNAIRFMQIVNIEVSDWKVNCYLVGSTLIAYLLYALKVNLTTFINLNGGVCLFFAMFAIPMYHHIKCNYFPPKQIEADPMDQQMVKWEEQDDKCYLQRQSQTNNEKIIDYIILTIMALFGLASLLITIKETIWGKKISSH